MLVNDANPITIMHGGGEGRGGGEENTTDKCTKMAEPQGGMKYFFVRWGMGRVVVSKTLVDSTFQTHLVTPSTPDVRLFT